MKAQLTILGSNSALPAQGRHPSAQILHAHNELFLIDCGEGTQLQMSNFGIRRSKISRIFISHLHGDHIFGLPGLITSFNHHGRKDKLTIFGPEGLAKFLEYSVYITGNPLNYELVVHEFNPDEKQNLVSSPHFEIDTHPLTHRIPTAGFIFKIKNPNLKIKDGVFDQYQVEHSQRSLIQKGADYIDENGKVIPNSVFTEPPASPTTYAYFSDTTYVPEYAEHIQNIDTLYHEATFMSSLQQKAIDTKHSTAKEAAMLAQSANASQLIIGHFSSRYNDLQPLLEEAQAVFPNTKLALEGSTFEIAAIR